MVGSEGWPTVVFQHNEVPAEYLGPITPNALANWTVQRMNKVEAILASGAGAGAGAGAAGAAVAATAAPANGTTTSNVTGTGGGASRAAAEALAQLFLRQPQAHNARYPLYSTACSGLS